MKTPKSFMQNSFKPGFDDAELPMAKNNLLENGSPG
jgi:hypothetical protein